MIEPVDWSALPRLRGDDVRNRRSLRACVTDAALRSVGATLAALVKLDVAIDAIDAIAGADRLDEIAATRVAGVEIDVALLGGRARLVLEPAFAIAIVGAFLGDRRSPVFSSSKSIDSAIAGAAGAIVEHLARRHVDAAACVRDAVDEAATFAAATTLAVRVGETSGLASLRVDRTLCRSLAGRDATIDIAGALALVPCRLCAVVAWGTLDGVDFAALRVGDALRFDAPSRVFHGHGFVLAPADLDEGMRVDRAADGGPSRWTGERVRLASVASTFDKAIAMGAREPSDRSDAGDATAVDTLDLLAALPVTVRAEIGSVTLSAKGWSTMRAGDVVVLDRSVGSPVILRANGVVVARGVAVDVDGVFGVRISDIEGERDER